MKITKDLLKQMIAEEMAKMDPQNEGVFDNLKAMVGLGHKFWDKHIPALETGYRSALASYGGLDGIMDERSDVIQKAYDEMNKFFLDWADKAEKGVKSKSWWLTMSGKQDKKYKAIQEKYRAIQADMLQALMKKARSESERAEAKRAYARLMAQKEDEERAMLDRAQKAHQRSLDPQNNPQKDPAAARPNAWMKAYDRYDESKVHNIRKIIVEEIVKMELENLAKRK